jgi:hypothetical protein
VSSTQQPLSPGGLTGGLTGGTGGSTGDENPLEFLRNQPQFQQMRQVIQQNPALLPALLQQLGRDNPQLLQVSGETGHPSDCMQSLSIHVAMLIGFGFPDPIWFYGRL